MAKRWGADDRKLHAVDVQSGEPPVFKPVAESVADAPGLTIIWPDEPKPRGNWIELVPGPGAPRNEWSGWVAISLDCWERYLEGLARYALPGYDPWGESTHDEKDVDRFCMLLANLQHRLCHVEDAKLIPVSFPELDDWTCHDLLRGHPGRALAIAKQLGGLVEWMMSTVRRCGALTVMGM